VQVQRGEEYRNMTTMTATNSVARSFDPVRARVCCAPIVTNAERLQAEEAALAERNRKRAPLGIDALRDTRLGRYVENMHPGDIVYWVACLGGACLLLIKATI
jgi:hypothetical protein